MTESTDRIEKRILLRAPLQRVWDAISDSKQFGIVCCLRQTKPSNGNDIMPQATQKANGEAVDVLISEEFHGDVAKWMSSAASTSMAYWMQARMSCSSRSG